MGLRMTSGTNEQSPPQGTGYTYADAGVSIAAGNALVKAIGPLAKATARPGATSELGGFGGFFDPKAAGYKASGLIWSRCASMT
jgi:phosphoribosylformylglycinamidine cyclo-ligase